MVESPTPLSASAETQPGHLEVARPGSGDETPSQGMHPAQEAGDLMPCLGNEKP